MTKQEIEQATTWIPNWHDTGACMDKRHILLLSRIIQSANILSAAEIGVHTAASSSAFIAAGIAHDTTFIDITRTKEARATLSKYNFAQMKGCDWMCKQKFLPQLVFIDGNHSMESVLEEVQAIEEVGLPQVLCGHDCNSTNVGFPHCEGAEMLCNWALHNYKHVYIDMKKRDGEMTHRGFFAATNDPWSAAYIEGEFKAVCGALELE